MFSGLLSWSQTVPIYYFIRQHTTGGLAGSDVVCDHGLISLSGQAQVELRPRQYHLWPPILPSCSQCPITFHLVTDDLRPHLFDLFSHKNGLCLIHIWQMSNVNTWSLWLLSPLIFILVFRVLCPSFQSFFSCQSLFHKTVFSHYLST